MHVTLTASGSSYRSHLQLCMGSPPSCRTHYAFDAKGNQYLANEMLARDKARPGVLGPKSVVYRETTHPLDEPLA